VEPIRSRVDEREEHGRHHQERQQDAPRSIEPEPVDVRVQATGPAPEHLDGEEKAPRS
jgi:hypothetical protein